MLTTTPLSKMRLYALLGLLIVIWGMSWPISKIGLSYMPALWFAACRLIIGTVAMLGVVVCLKKFLIPRKQDLKLIFVLGTIQIAAFMMLFTIGLQYVAPGRSAFLVYTTPIWIIPISVIMFREKMTWYKSVSSALGLAGIIVLTNPWAIDWHHKTELLGTCLLLAAALSWSVAILCARHMKWSRTPLELIFWQLLVATCWVVVAAIIFSPLPSFTMHPILLGSLLFNGILSTAFAYWGTVVISKELPPITLSLSLLAIPLLGLVSSMVLTGEKLTLSLSVAMTLIGAALICVALDKPKKNKIPIIPE